MFIRPLKRRPLDLTLQFKTSSLLDGVENRATGKLLPESTGAEISTETQLASTHFSGHATFPCVHITDLYSSGWAKHYAWDMMSVQSLNKESLSIVTDAENRVEQVLTPTIPHSRHHNDPLYPQNDVQPHADIFH